MGEQIWQWYFNDALYIIIILQLTCLPPPPNIHHTHTHTHTVTISPFNCYVIFIFFFCHVMFRFYTASFFQYNMFCLMIFFYILILVVVKAVVVVMVVVVLMGMVAKFEQTTEKQPYRDKKKNVKLCKSPTENPKQISHFNLVCNLPKLVIKRL